MCRDVMSAVRARCPDCLQILEVPYSWCDDARGFINLRGQLDDQFAEQILIEHARRWPILHPTVLPDHHRMRRPV